MVRSFCWGLGLLSIFLGLGPRSVHAQSTQGQPLGWIYLSSDNTTYHPDIHATAFVPFTFYMMLDLDYGFINRADLNASTGVQAWEASLIVPAEFTILQATVRGQSISLGDLTNLIVGLSTPILANETPIDLVEFSLGAFSPSINLTDVVLDIGASSPSSFSPAAPGMNDSADIGECMKISDGSTVKCIRPFAKVSRAVINCSAACISICIIGCATENTRWSTIKATFAPGGG